MPLLIFILVFKLYAILHFPDNNKLQRHRTECNKMVTTLPSMDDRILKYKNHKNQLDVPFVVYADFECILEEINVKNSDKINLIQKHVPYAYSYYIKCSFNNDLDIFRIYHGEDCSSNFFKTLLDDCITIYETYLSHIKPMNPLTIFQLNSFTLEQNCHICRNLFINNDKVIDHCHLTGDYRGAAHNDCNLNYKLAKFIPIFFHNLSAYDCHLFVKELSAIDGEINIIPQLAQNIFRIRILNLTLIK